MTEHAAIQTPAVDWERLREVTAGNAQLLREISRLYLDQAAEILAEMEQCLARSDLEGLRKQAHTLAGSSATCGMSAMIAPLRALEASDQDGIGGSRLLHEDAKIQLLRVRNSLTAALPPG